MPKSISYRVGYHQGFSGRAAHPDNNTKAVWFFASPAPNLESLKLEKLDLNEAIPVQWRKKILPDDGAFYSFEIVVGDAVSNSCIMPPDLPSGWKTVPLVPADFASGLEHGFRDYLSRWLSEREEHRHNDRRTSSKMRAPNRWHR